MFDALLMPRHLATVLLCVSAAAATAAPVVVDFESAPPLTLVGPTQPDTQYTESGITFTPSGGDAMVDASYCALFAESCISNNNSVYLTAFDGATVTISASSGFTLDSLDASFFPAPTPAGVFSGLNFGLQLLGTLWGGGSTSATLSLSEDASFLGDFLFDSYNGLGAAQLASVTFSACWYESAGNCTRDEATLAGAGLLFNDLAFALDNLSITTSGNVPEPSALWLSALALGGLMISRRRAAR